MKQIMMTALMLMVGQFAFSQYTFTGKVVDEDGEPLIGASVIEKGTENGTLTNVEGEYSLEADDPKIDVIFSFLGEPVQKTLIANEFFVLNINQNSNLAPVFVSDKYPVTETTTSINNEINLGQDIPILLDQLPSVVTTSDAGGGVGYTGIRVRGSDATRVNVTINGIPLNDSESQGVFWVNTPDFSSSTEKVTLVRGVGTSTNGAGAFGASLHIQTEEIPEEGFVEYNGSIGSFNTFKNNVKFGSGEKNGWSASGRVSRITSDGFIDRAESELESYFLQAQKEFGDNSTLKFITFKGHEQTYQAWFGVPEGKLFGEEPEFTDHFNRNNFPVRFGGLYESEEDRQNYFESDNRSYNFYTYENQEDNYQQEHFQLLWDQGFGQGLTLNTGLHYTKGAGFFEEFRQNDFLSTYGITSPFSETSDLVRRRWLDNDFYGLVTTLNVYNGPHFLQIGGGINRYVGDHFGEVIQGEFVPTEAIGENYFFNGADKDDANIYAKYTYDIESNSGLFRPFVDLQFRPVQYGFEGLTLNSSGEVVTLPIDVSNNFFNPKFGLSYESGSHAAYASFARGQKEPNRADFVDSPADRLPVPEELNDYEIGYSYETSGFTGSVNGYYLDYTNQLAVSGGVNDVGGFTRINVEDSYRAGIELVGQYSSGNFFAGANATFSQNKINDFTENFDRFFSNGDFVTEQINHGRTDLALSPNIIAGGNVGVQSSNGLLRANLIGKYVGDQFLDNTSTESRAIDAYFVSNFSGSIDLGRYIKELSAVEINLLVNNILNAEYESNGYTFGFGFDDADIYENYYYPQAGTNFLTGLKVRF